MDCAGPSMNYQKPSARPAEDHHSHTRHAVAVSTPPDDLHVPRQRNCFMRMSLKAVFSQVDLGLQELIPTAGVYHGLRDNSDRYEARAQPPSLLVGPSTTYNVTPTLNQRELRCNCPSPIQYGVHNHHQSPRKNSQTPVAAAGGNASLRRPMVSNRAVFPGPYRYTTYFVLCRAARLLQAAPLNGLGVDMHPLKRFTEATVGFTGWICWEATVLGVRDGGTTVLPSAYLWNCSQFTNRPGHVTKFVDGAGGPGKGGATIEIYRPRRLFVKTGSETGISILFPVLEVFCFQQLLNSCGLQFQTIAKIK
ncbi:hypothetical protein ACRALDRAFT_206384 [Sodiomyces alcalophilus JCM 7366]|uniref:uncharacterized protein n=1 Tax=Sodiomyces alcalophilus JCM 7366 TaxID=591952 RepID=UPI0039B3C11F